MQATWANGLNPSARISFFYDIEHDVHPGSNFAVRGYLFINRCHTDAIEYELNNHAIEWGIS